MIKPITGDRMLKTFISITLLGGMLTLASCTLPEGLNDNPNEITLSDVDARLFLNGAQLANNVVQAGHLNRISGMYSGQLIGFTSLYSNIYGYSLSTVESDGVWRRIYTGVVTNLRHIQAEAPDDMLLTGIAKVVEAHAVGTGATLFGNVPYTEIGTDVEDPIFDSQSSVFTALIALLDAGIADLGAASSRSEPSDLYFEGDATKWVQAAYTLKARYMLQMKNYTGAYTAAQSGISSAGGDMMYTPQGEASNASGDKNLFWTILAGSRTGDIGTGDSYLMQLLDPANSSSRNHSKTDETARFMYYEIDESAATANLGIIEQYEPHRLVTYSENLLILAEAGARADFATGLIHLNDLRAYLNGGGWLNANFSDSAYAYTAYVSTDFDAGGIENADGSLTAARALLREIIEERFVSGFGTYIPFNDARRLRKSDGDITVPIPFNNNTATAQPERLPYAEDEMNSNSNAPDADPGLFSVTEVNQ